MTQDDRSSLKSWRWAVGAMMAGFALIAGAVLFSGGITTKQLPVAQQPSGAARLISVEPLAAPVQDGEMCEWIPASSTSNLTGAAALQDEASVGAQAARSANIVATTDLSSRKPARLIRDPYSAYSSVAVDVANNEVVLTDENLFGVLVYDRQANTPPKATMTEPKRMITGPQTKIEYQCGLYVDPKNGDIYAVNNDTVDTLVIFSRQVKGDQSPTRELETPHGTYGIAIDEVAQELFLTVQHDSAVVVYKKMAQGKESPIRLLQGDHTRMADPHGMALDTKNNLIFVANHGSTHRVDPSAVNLPSTGRWFGYWEGKKNWPLGLNFAVPGSGKMLPATITVYPKTAQGDAPPVRVIEGPKTQLNWPTGIAVDPDHDELYVTNDVGDSILVFKASANGDVAPLRVLRGPQTLIKNPTGIFLDTKNHELWVSNFGNHTATVYKPTAEGDTPPLRVIRSAPLGIPAPSLNNPFPVAYDEKREQILVPN